MTLEEEKKATGTLPSAWFMKRYDGSKFCRTAITILFSLSLFFFIHLREVKVPLFDIGSKASQYVVAEIPFAFPDEEATAIARQEALLDIGKIYAIDQEDVLQRGVEFENSLIYDQQWREKAPNSTFDEMCRANELLERALLEIRFTDPRTLEKAKQLGLDCSALHEITPFDISQGAYFPAKIWEFIQQRAFAQQTLHPKTVEFVLGFFREKIWILKEDIQMMRALRKRIQEFIPEKYMSVQQGNRIIDSGEKVTPRHNTMLQAMKVAMSERRNLWHIRTVVGSLLLTACFVTVILLFLQRYQPAVAFSNSSYLLYVSIFLLGLCCAKACELIFVRGDKEIFEFVHYPLFTPIVALLFGTLLNHQIALFSVAIMAVLYDMSLAFNDSGLLVLNVLVGSVVVFYTKTLRRRLEIVAVSLKGWVAACVTILALHFYDKTQMTTSIVEDVVGAGAFMLMTSILVVGVLPLFESVFQILTDINLMEYMDPNQELLRRLMVEAPGTYQHCVIMGGLAEGAAQAIGCNGLFCRVAALYHDIGKISIAQYFTENQQSGMNIHQLLTPVESAKVIISHVAEGIALVRKARLPEPFIDIIREHHGTSLVYYFYHKQLEAVGHDYSQVKESDFCYHGPKPHSKESGIIMIADAFEAASRSLEEINETTLRRLVDQIMKEKMDDRQLDECQLTFEELSVIKDAMIRGLLSIGHFRVKYPARYRMKAL